MPLPRLLSRLTCPLVPTLPTPNLLRAGYGLLTQVMHKSGSHTPMGALSSKRGNKNFYKGKGGKKYGKPNQYGNFVLRKEGKPSWKMPDLDGFMLKPYVHVASPAVPPPAPAVIATQAASSSAASGASQVPESQ